MNIDLGPLQFYMCLGRLLCGWQLGAYSMLVDLLVSLGIATNVPAFEAAVFKLSFSISLVIFWPIWVLVALIVIVSSEPAITLSSLTQS